MNDLNAPSLTQPKGQTTQKNPKRNTNMNTKDDLENLMNDLDNTKIPKQTEIKSLTSELDDLMKDISVPIKTEPQRSTLGRVTKTTNELDNLVQDLVDTSKKVRNNNEQNNDSLSQIMNDLEITARSSGTLNVNKPLVQPLTQNNRVNELDNIMNNLNKPIPSGVGLNNQNQNLGGVCSSCRKKIVGDIIQALGKQYHPEHFLCTSCGTLLGGGNFYEQEGQPQCEQCFYSHFCMQCASCGLPITSQVINAIGSNWHPSCFVCTNCLGGFNDGSYFERDGRPFCSKCFNEVFAPRCKSCSNTISGNCINAMGSQWHPEHFVCQYCRRPFQGGLFYEVSGLPYCEAHYQLHQQRIARGLPGINTLQPLTS